MGDFMRNIAHGWGVGGGTHHDNIHTPHVMKTPRNHMPIAHHDNLTSCHMTSNTPNHQLRQIAIALNRTAFFCSSTAVLSKASKVPLWLTPCENNSSHACCHAQKDSAHVHQDDVHAFIPHQSSMHTIPPSLSSRPPFTI